jgi:hypothetical protein
MSTKGIVERLREFAASAVHEELCHTRRRGSVLLAEVFRRGERGGALR